MTPMTLEAETVTIGRWEFSPSECLVRGAEEERRLENRAARALAVLCEHRGQVVSKDELIASVWRGRAVSPNSVAVVIGDLRRVLEDDPGAPVHIVTVNKRGYRLSAAPCQIPAEPISRPRATGCRLLALTSIVAALVVVAGAASHVSTRPVNLLISPVVDETGRRDLGALSRSLDAVITDSAVHLRNVRVIAARSHSDSGGANAWTMRSRLIMWNGAPELAITVVENDSGRVIWGGFAGGPPEGLAKAVGARISAFGARSAM
jgi:DNA-binding winged helix-turn-helix (wHTH) protein